jgi:hypothetical protein
MSDLICGLCGHKLINHIVTGFISGPWGFREFKFTKRHFRVCTECDCVYIENQ